MGIASNCVSQFPPINIKSTNNPATRPLAQIATIIRFVIVLLLFGIRTAFSKPRHDIGAIAANIELRIRKAPYNSGVYKRVMIGSVNNVILIANTWPINIFDALPTSDDIIL